MKMKIKLIAGVMMVTAISQLVSCSKDEDKPKTLPTVVTGTDIVATTTTATVTGEITNDGNSRITEAGFVYSSNIPEPTTADNKKTITDFEEFVAELTGLTSGTDYYVRAYAINSKGTAYGDVETFETGNLAPTVTNVQITGTLEVAKTLTATYTYTDPEGDTEDVSPTGTAFQWYVADDGTGLNEAAIVGATAKTFVVTDVQNGKVLKVKVTPKATEGTITGGEVLSSYTTAIGAETVTFMYMGTSVTYGTIIGPSGRKWLDRNLGALQVATAIDDYRAFGDMFQWGRPADGHQKVTRTDNTDGGATGVTGITSLVEPYETSDDDTPETDKFIVDANFGSRDWRTTQNDNLWQGVNGVNNPCPTGWRLPTQAEWIAENLTTPASAFTLLKLTLAGRRGAADGTFAFTSATGYYWSSTPSVEDRRAYQLFNGPDEIYTGTFATGARANAASCRCIKN